MAIALVRCALRELRQQVRCILVHRAQRAEQLVRQEPARKPGYVTCQTGVQLQD
jgi:hypothetical protein